MGLDRDDPVIRRRLQQKLEFVTDDVAVPAEPTDADLGRYLKAHADIFHSIVSLPSGRCISIQVSAAKAWPTMSTNCRFSCDRRTVLSTFTR